MMTSRLIAQKLCSILIFVVAALLLSCTPKVRPVYEDPSFTGGALHAGGLAVLGVVGRDLTNPEEGQVADQADQCLAASMKKMLPGVNVLEATALRDRVGETAFKEVRLDLADSDSLASDAQRTLADSTANLPAYLAVARVGKEKHWYEMNADGKGGIGYRQIELRVNIYRVADGLLVWSQYGKFTKGEPQTKEQRIDLGPVTLGGDGDDWTPPPPKVTQILTSIFNKIGETLARRP